MDDSRRETKRPLVSAGVGGFPASAYRVQLQGPILCAFYRLTVFAGKEVCVLSAFASERGKRFFA